MVKASSSITIEPPFGFACFLPDYKPRHGLTTTKVRFNWAISFLPTGVEPLAQRWYIILPKNSAVPPSAGALKWDRHKPTRRPDLGLLYPLRLCFRCCLFCFRLLVMSAPAAESSVADFEYPHQQSSIRSSAEATGHERHQTRQRTVLWQKETIRHESLPGYPICGGSVEMRVSVIAILTRHNCLRSADYRAPLCANVFFAGTQRLFHI